MQRYQITCANPFLGESILYECLTHYPITTNNFNYFDEMREKLSKLPVGKYKIYRISIRDKVHRFSIDIYEQDIYKIVDVHLVLGEPPKYGRFTIMENLIAKYGQELVRIFN